MLTYCDAAAAAGCYPAYLCGQATFQPCCCGKLQSPKLCFKIPIFFQMMNPIDIRPSPCPAQSERDMHAKFRRHTLRRFGVSGYLNSTVLLLKDCLNIVALQATCIIFIGTLPRAVEDIRVKYARKKTVLFVF